MQAERASVSFSLTRVSHHSKSAKAKAKAALLSILLNATNELIVTSSHTAWFYRRLRNSRAQNGRSQLSVGRAANLAPITHKCARRRILLHAAKRDAPIKPPLGRGCETYRATLHSDRPINHTGRLLQANYIHGRPIATPSSHTFGFLTSSSVCVWRQHTIFISLCQFIDLIVHFSHLYI